MMYTSGWPKNQNRCCHSKGSPCSVGLKNWVPTSRSLSSIPLASATLGMERITISEVTRIAQANKGMRSRLIPGARCLRMVAVSTTATDSAATSVKVTICAQMSARLPTPYSGPESGT